MREKEDKRQESKYKKEKGFKKGIREKQKLSACYGRGSQCLSISLKTMNMQLSKACKIQMLKKKKQNNNSISF